MFAIDLIEQHNDSTNINIGSDRRMGQYGGSAY